MKRLRLYNQPELSMYSVEGSHVVAIGDDRQVFKTEKLAEKFYTRQFKAMIKDARQRLKGVSA